jgi:plasmid maintenance system antidote protein VapI
MKEVAHPGKILYDILMTEEGCFYIFSSENWCDKKVIAVGHVADMLNIERRSIENLLNCVDGVSRAMAYKLGKHIKGTDMAFWLKLQEDYENYQRQIGYFARPIEFDAASLEKLLKSWEFKICCPYKSKEVTSQSKDICNASEEVCEIFNRNYTMKEMQDIIRGIVEKVVLKWSR